MPKFRPVARRLLPALCCGLLLLLASGCRSVPSVVKIGLVAPFEGRHRPVGYDLIYSARLAVREINNDGGVGGVRLALVALDDGGDPELARATAAALISDPGVVAVIGHWLPETTAAAQPLYAAAGLPLIAAGSGADAFGPFEPAALPDAFRQAYAAVTPFDEVAGPYAAPAYDALYLLRAALETAGNSGTIDRSSVLAALGAASIDGLTGRVAWDTAAGEIP